MLMNTLDCVALFASFLRLSSELTLDSVAGGREEQMKTFRARGATFIYPLRALLPSHLVSLMASEQLL
jgi:hypothetical protein